MKKAKGRTDETIKQAMIDMQKPFTGQTLTIPCDNGKEYTDHPAIVRTLNADV